MFEKGYIPWNKGKRGLLKHSEETKKKIREGNIGKHSKLFTKEQKENLSLARKGMKLSEKHRKNISKALLGSKNPQYGKCKSEEQKRQISIALKGKGLSEAHKRKISVAKKGKRHTEEQKSKMSRAKKGKRHTEEEKRKISIALKGKRFSEAHKRKIGEKSKISWENKEIREKRIQRTLKALFETRPTSLERDMIKIIEKYQLPYVYTGDGSFLVGYKNPDFINTNGEKICIEIGNTFHHDNNYERERIEHFAKYGWKCIVFLTDNLNEEQVLAQLKSQHII